MELVGKIREKLDINRSTANRPIMAWTLSDSEAAALIEARDGTVPRAMMMEVLIYSNSVGFNWNEVYTIAAKHGVKVGG